MEPSQVPRRQEHCREPRRITTGTRYPPSVFPLPANAHQEVVALDADIKTAYTAYQNVKTSLISVQRKATGNLTTRSLAPLLSRNDFVPDSEYLETLLIVVPKQSQKEWLKTYETLTDMVVPRSSQKLAEDDEYALYNVTLFKKFSAEFMSKARAAKFTPRDFTWSENAAEVDAQEARDVEKQERQLFSEIIHLARTGYSDLFAAWIHVKALRVFVESVLRYGLPLEFVSAVVKTNGEKAAKKAKGQLDAAFGYLGGNAFGRDKKGNIKDDVGDMGALAHGQEDYSAYCYFEFEVA
jgi:V-type H+-transporting ATPase subunit C